MWNTDDLYKPGMFKIGANNYVFFIAAVCSMAFSYALFGVSSLAFAAIAVIHTFIIHSAKEKNGDYVYTLIWICITVTSCYIGYHFKLSVEFYLFLFIVSTYYYLSYNKDPFSEKAIPFVIVFATLGTTLKTIDYHMFAPYLFGAIISLVAMRIAYKNKLDFTGFKAGLFSGALYANRNRHIIVSSLIYSIFLFLSLFIPDYLGLERVYWSSLTFVFLLQPQVTGIVKSTILRFVGGVVAALAVAFIINSGLHTRLIGILILLAFLFLFPTFNNSNKLGRTFCLSFLVLLLIEYSLFWGNPDNTLAHARIYETFIGGCVALLGGLALHLVNRLKKKDTV